MIDAAHRFPLLFEASLFPYGGHYAEVEVIHNGMWRTGLAFYAAGFLLDLFETGPDFPAIAIVFDDLLDGQIKIGGKYSVVKERRATENLFADFWIDEIIQGPDTRTILIETGDHKLSEPDSLR
ncbi:hypothetical protein SAMN05421690_102530 [Nitrosomonas sp. Nm51]|nr:hypothetical protein SAMN05421690_102530 [Nitrosomonas sp. Nm51]